MIFSKSRPVKIVLVGTGGTGGYIVPQLYRLLYALDRPIRVILCDGDLVEEKNLGRQNFIEADLGKNKAMVLAERYPRLADIDYDEFECYDPAALLGYIEESGRRMWNHGELIRSIRKIPPTCRAAFV